MRYLLFALLFSFNTYAQFDLRLGAQGRTFPAIGASALVETGYNQLLWGQDGKDKIAYGFMRPYYFGQLSGVVNSHDVGLELFPISILGLNVGKTYAQSTFDFPNFDCEEIDCSGYASGDFTEYKGVLGAAGFVLMGRSRMTKFTNDSRNKAFTDWQNVLRMAPEEDNLLFSEIIGGYITKVGLIGVINRTARYEESKDQLDMNALVFITRREANTLVLGVGNMKTTTQDNWDREIDGTVVIFQWRREFAPSMRKF
jgi:hypothetical protein